MQREEATWTIPPRAGTITALAWSADGHKLAVVTNRGWLMIWSPMSKNTERATARVCQRLGRMRLLTVAWARQGHALAVGGENGTLYRIQVQGMSCPVVTQHLFADAITRLAWSSSPLDRCLVVACSRLTVVDPRGVQMTVQYPASILDAAWSIDGRTFALVCQGGLVEVWDAERQQPSFSSSALVGAQCLSWSRDGQRIALGTKPGLLHQCYPRAGAIDETLALTHVSIAQSRDASNVSLEFRICGDCQGNRLCWNSRASNLPINLAL